MANSNWILDKSKSNIRFKVKHLLVANIQGEFEDFDISVTNEGERLVEKEFKLDIKAKSINTRLQQRDDHLRSLDFLNTEEFPNITFKSSEISEIKQNSYKLHGELTLVGVSKEFDLYASFTESQDEDTLGDFSLEVNIKRSEFGLNWNNLLGDKWVIVDDVIKLYGNIRLLNKKPGDRVKGLAGRADVVRNENYQLFNSLSDSKNGTLSWSQLKENQMHWIFGVTTGDTDETYLRALKTKLYIESLTKEYNQVNSTNQFLRILHFALQDDNFLTRSIYDNNTYSLDTGYFIIDKSGAKIRYCSARLNVVLLKSNGLKLFPKNNISIGFPYYNSGQLAEHVIPYDSGDTLVVFNDEFIKQAGGKYGKKLGAKTVGNILSENRQQPWGNRGEHLQKVLNQWVGNGKMDQILIAQIKL